jgi:hypothetical protein
MFHAPALTHLTDRIALKITEVRALGSDWRIIADVAAAGPG